MTIAVYQADAPRFVRGSIELYRALMTDDEARALLAEQQVAVRDETGWTLSTTRAAAVLMSLLRALPRQGVLRWAVDVDPLAV